MHIHLCSRSYEFIKNGESVSRCWFAKKQMDTVHLMFLEFFILLNLANYIRTVETVQIIKKAFLINNVLKKRDNKKNRTNVYLINTNNSYLGSEYIFNKICNDSVKHKGDKASELLHRANYIRDVNGLYNILPLGLKVIEKIIIFLNTHLRKINSHCLVLSILQAKKWWNISDRSKLYSDEFLYVYKQKQQKSDCTTEGGAGKKKIEDDGHILSPTCEEHAISLINQVFNENITIKSLPLLIHQFNYKFRNEKRLEKTLFKSKEFLMKDGYSFHGNDMSLYETYELYKECYKNIFSDLKLQFKITKKRKMDKMNAQESHEFQVLCRDDKYREAAHIFKLGDYYSKKLDIKYLNKQNQKNDIIMGSYGIGIYRLLYFLVDTFYDHDGIRLPQQVAPFTVYMIQKNQKSKYSASKIAKIMRTARKNVLKGERDDLITPTDDSSVTAPQKTDTKYSPLLSSYRDVPPSLCINDDNTFCNSINSNDVEYVLTLWLYNTFKNNNVDTYYDDTDLHLSRKLKNCDLIGVPNRIIINLNNDQRKTKLPPDFYMHLDTSNAILSNKLYMTFRDITVEYKNRFSSETKIMTIHQLFRHFKLI
ncbi:proline--tRNA ligase [Plasmodium gonderi]|uniref:Proline--tRNA ligase n=1 Tax=Plasmodium gonderi TaxID=77519 RepID=A0A1Y1JCV3_PLAGO|nr:proline--tRNA ligase [Plasmodium gonderi]GAW80316.1 proline--tRNA ligase [Plasmodium gonderi]